MTTSFLATLAFALVATAIVEPHSQMPGFRASAITRVGRLAFDAPLATVFPLFTPQGERHWAKGWDPQIVHPFDRDIADGMVFLTRDDDGVAVWTVTRYDAAGHIVAYNVVVADVLVRSIAVTCRAAAPARTEVEVTDTYVALSPRGNAFVEQLTDAAYVAKMDGWKDAIGNHLASLAKRPH